MYCPRCGQQQISDQMRFCSRCGLPMSGLAEWLDVSGLPAGREQEAQIALRSPRRKGIRRGSKVMFFSGALFPLFLLLSIAVDDPTPLLLPTITFIVGLTIRLYSRLFVEDFTMINNQQTQRPGLGVVSETRALPPGSSTPISAAGNLPDGRVRTNELDQPRSVTEHTTKLLDQE